MVLLGPQRLMKFLFFDVIQKVTLHNDSQKTYKLKYGLESQYIERYCNFQRFYGLV